MRVEKASEGTSAVQRRLAVALTMIAFGGASLLVAAREPRAARADQPAPAPEPAPAPKTTAFADLPPTLRLGVRSASVQQQMPVHPTLVLVPDEAAYIAAIASWRTTETGALRFPVLIDRGTYQDQQRIARFARAFRPEHVVRWKPPIEKSGALPADRIARQRRIEDALVAAWGAKDIASLKARWDQFKFTPPGLVVAWGDDPAWTGALALAAGRGQPIAWVQPRGGGPGNLAMEADADAMRADIDIAIKNAEYPYDKIGDALDAITLCLNAPPKVLLAERDPRKMLALTDVIGRGKDGKRFAWTGQVFGDSAQSAYLAMCSLFVPAPANAWLFDGYDDSKPWVLFDASDAADKLRSVSLRPIVDDPKSGGSLDDWRARIAGIPGRFDKDAPTDPVEVSLWGFGVDAQLINVTTSGNPDFFELKPGVGHSVDVPILRTPAAVHFVHSWSANNPLNRGTIAGVWMERGVFAYAGSVHEPFLSAFVPSPMLMTRLTAGLPWGVATRIDDADAWKVAVIGDPLYTIIARPAPRTTEALPLTGASDVSDAVPGLLKDKKYIEALRALCLLGRDRDAARLLGALLREKPVPPTRDLALAGVAGAFHAGDLDTLIAAARVILPEQPKNADADPAVADALNEVRDMLWHVLWPRRAALAGDAADLLLRALRPDNLVADARDLIDLVKAQRLSAPEPRSIIIAAQGLTTDRATADALDKLPR